MHPSIIALLVNEAVARRADGRAGTGGWEGRPAWLMFAARCLCGIYIPTAT